VPIISNFIETELARLAAIAPKGVEPAEPEKLNTFFREFCLAEAA
jgi:hypothetical protein